jgi:hypothetical protein
MGLTKTEKEQLQEDGIIICKNYFSKDYIEAIREKAKEIFNIQFKRFDYVQDDFQSNMIRLFSEHENDFINCGKIIQQGLIELYRLSVEDRLIQDLKNIGLEFPNLCTRPVLYFNHPKLAKQEVYYKTPLHQDWSSMESSSDSVVIWVPLVDVNEENGAVIFYPKTHKLGALPFQTNGGFAEVQIDENIYAPIQPTLNVGDIAIFSTLLVHKSGDIKNDKIRWSCHFRYTNMLDYDYIQRGFPNPYIYKPLIKGK